MYEFGDMKINVLFKIDKSNFLGYNKNKEICINEAILRFNIRR